ncbi:hypothetical protein [Geodermatophilus sp. URMC 62]|uniref:hypothetical protein n=1 Tax=Geodermatophilus sp. URMC 62 TaxID=3423414 RepID=UPI00406D2E82
MAEGAVMTYDAGPGPSGDVRWGDLVPVRVGGLWLQLPAALVPGGGRAFDGPAAVFEGPGVTVVVDVGPFADRLDGHAGKPAFHEALVDVAGARGRRVTFRTPDAGTSTSALHVDAPRPFTVAVITEPSVPDAVAAGVLASVQLA